MEVHQSQSATISDTPFLEDAVIDEAQAAAPRRVLRAPKWLAILWQNRKSRVGLVLLALFAVAAIFAPVIAPYDPRDTSFESNLNPTADHWLGTTTAGQDIYSQLIWSARTSLTVGLFAGGLATAISLVIGLTAGYMRGMVDEVLSFFINLALVIPTFPLIAVIAAYSPVRGILPIILILGITGWAWGARIKRSQMISMRERDYITASIFAGEPTWRVIFREIMPNMLSLVVVGFIGASAGAIGAEAGLAFIGLGDPTTVSWGSMLFWADNSGALLTGQWAWLLAPGLALALLMTALTLVNFGIDALSNPHLREE
jgi:peptide/nickel transport system permease protein